MLMFCSCCTEDKQKKKTDKWYNTGASEVYCAQCTAQYVAPCEKCGDIADVGTGKVCYYCENDIPASWKENLVNRGYF